MPYDLARHPFFTAWTDPQSGVESFILTERVAPMQKGFYYTQPGVSADGRWLWFQTLFPPSTRTTLAAVCLDPDDPQIRTFPACTGPGNAMLRDDSQSAFVPIHDRICIQHLDGRIEDLLRLPRQLIANRHLFRCVTTTTRSADGRLLLFDAHIGNRFLIAVGDLQTREITPLRWFFHQHHHAMFSPTEPELFMLGQGPWHDPITGEKGDMNVRMWLMDINLTRYEPVFGDLWFNRNCMSCHEWWTPDGMINWCDYVDGVYECDTSPNRSRTLIWPHGENHPHGLCHAHCDRNRRYYVGDEDPYCWSADNPCRVFFFDRRTGREVAIASGLPEPPVPAGDRRAFHLDPHPHFSPDDELIIYTTSVYDAINVAVTPTAAAIARL